jgi:PhnB protein
VSERVAALHPNRESPGASSPVKAAAPPGYGTVTPWVVSRETAKLIAFMALAFDAKEKDGSRQFNPDGSIAHVEVELGDSVIMLFDARPNWPDTPGFLRLYVEDADIAFQRALDAGAHSVTKPTELFWGDRVGRVVDPCGNIWWLQARAAVAPENIDERSRDPAVIRAMQVMQESLDDEMMRRKGTILSPRGLTVDDAPPSRTRLV